jgi:hypothetical protein
MNHYFYAPSYVTLRVYLFLKEYQKDLILVSGNKNLIDFAKYMEWEIIEFDAPQPVKSVRSIRFYKELPVFWKALHKEINSILGNLDSGVFYFSTLLIDLFCLKMVQRIAEEKKMKLIYLDDVEVTKHHKIKKRIPIETKVHQVKFTLQYLLPFKVFDTGGGGIYYGVDDSFLDKYGIIHDKSPEQFRPKMKMRIVPIAESIDVLIVGAGNIDENKDILNPESTRCVFQYIKKLRPDAFFKYHPGEIVHDELSDSFRQVKPFIPVEFFYKSIKLALSDYSYALVNLSLHGVKCVSYLHLLESYPKFDKVYWVDKLSKDSNGKIIFVRSFDELKMVLEN